jgi:hypothetical protein
MTIVETFEADAWGKAWAPVDQERATDALEEGRVLFLPRLGFALQGPEVALLTHAWSLGSSKNISFNPATGRLDGLAAPDAMAGDLAHLMARYAAATRALLDALLPAYRTGLETSLTSFRPVEIDGRPTTPQRDDRRLHVDAFPSRPMGGRRILRVFSNVSIEGRDRVWQVGEPFERFAKRFLPRLNEMFQERGAAGGAPADGPPGRTRYDRAMLRLHDLAKGDSGYQETAPRERIEFPPGSTWVVFTDQVLHAVLSGRQALEQTFHIPVATQRHPQTAPIRVLERLAGRSFIGA